MSELPKLPLPVMCPGILPVRLHHQGSRSTDAALADLCQQLTDSRRTPSALAYVARNVA